MKLKKKGFSLVAVCLSVAFAVLSFIALTFKFVVVEGVGSGSSKESISLGDWNKALNDSDAIKMTEKATDANYGLWQFSRVLMIIALIVIAVVAVLALVQLFVEHKALALTTKITGIVSIVLTAAFFICFAFGGVLASFSETTFGTTVGVNYYPQAGSILLTLFGVLTAVFALLASKKQKA